ncbi:hypothetical protein [Enterococcus olivae]
MRKKSVYYNFDWVGYLLLFMGVLFMIPAFVMQVVPFGPHNFSFTLNGVPMPYNEENLQMFRRIFLLAFGIPALILVLIGGIVLIRRIIKNNRDQRLKEMEQPIVCHNLNLEYSSVQVNYQNKRYLTCSYTDDRGDTYLFKSRILRYDPLPYLDGTVNVYQNEFKPKQYFVDVEGSMQPVYEM